MKTEDGIIEYENYVSNLERSCDEWAEVSQKNYQRANKYRAALEKIAQNQYGLQSILEDCPYIDSLEYLTAALEYYSRLVRLYQKIAREELGFDNNQDRSKL
jgi:hypothetical protein